MGTTIGTYKIKCVHKKCDILNVLSFIYVHTKHSKKNSFEQALIEICLLSGGTPHANFKHFCHAWGRDATFVHRLSNFICERRGDTDRKKVRSNTASNQNNNNNGTTIEKRNLKKTGVIIPRTTPLEMYRNGILADTIAPSHIVEPTVVLPVMVDPPNVDTTGVDEVDMVDVTAATTTTNPNDNRGVLDTMLGHESEPFLLMDESMDDTNPQDHPDMTQV